MIGILCPGLLAPEKFVVEAMLFACRHKRSQPRVVFVEDRDSTCGVEQLSPANCLQLAPEILRPLQDRRVMPALRIHLTENPRFTGVGREGARDRKAVDSDDPQATGGKLPTCHAPYRADSNDYDVRFKCCHVLTLFSVMRLGLVQTPMEAGKRFADIVLRMGRAPRTRSAL